MRCVQALQPATSCADQATAAPEVEKHGGVIQVVMTPDMRAAFEQLLKARGMFLYRMPIESEDDLDTYGIGIRP